MKKHAILIILILLGSLGSSLQAEEIHSLELYRLRIIKALHQTLQQDYKPAEYQLEVTIQGKAVLSQVSEAREIRRANDADYDSQSYLPPIEDVLGKRVYKVEKSKVRLTLQPNITEANLAKLQSNISKIAQLDAYRGDQIFISAVVLPATLPTPGIVERKTEKVEPLATAIVPEVATESAANKSAAQKEGFQFTQILPYFIAAAVTAIFILLWVATRRGRNKRKPVTAKQLKSNHTLDQFAALAKAKKKQPRKDFAAELEAQVNEVGLEGQFEDFAAISEVQAKAPTKMKKQAKPAFNTELMIESVTGYPSFQFVQGLTLQGIQRLLKGETLPAKAWVLRSVKNELVSPVLKVLGREHADDVKWELIHLSLYERAEVEALEARLQEKANQFMKAKAPHLKAVQSRTKNAVSKPFDFETIKDLPKEILKTLVGMMSVEDLMVASNFSSKKLQEKLLFAMSTKNRKDFLVSIGNLHATVEDSLVAQGRMLAMLKQIAEQRRLNLNQFKTA